MKRLTKYGPVMISLIVSLGLMAVFLTRASAEGVVDLGVTISAPQHAAPGETYAANIKYSNLGDTASPDDTQVSLLLPDGVEFVSATDRLGGDLPPSSISGSLLIWQVGALPAGDCCQHIFATLAVADDRPEGEELVLQAEISSAAVEADVTNNIASATSVVCDMAGSTKQVHAGQVRPGDVLTYTIQLRLALRQGNTVQMRNVTLTDTLPALNQVRFLGWVGPHTGEVEGNQLRWQGTVQAGEPLTLQYRLGVEGDVPPGEMITNTAEVASGGIKLRLGPVASEVELPPHAVMVGPFGHTWQIHEGLTVEIPEGAVQETARFEYQLMNGEPPDEPPAGYVYAHRFFELNAYRFGELNEFGETLRLKLKLQPEEIAGLKRESLQLWSRAGEGEPWQMMGEPEWLSEDTVVFSTVHFTQFALFGTGLHQIYLPLMVRY